MIPASAPAPAPVRGTATASGPAPVSAPVPGASTHAPKRRSSPPLYDDHSDYRVEDLRKMVIAAVVSDCM